MDATVQSSITQRVKNLVPTTAFQRTSAMVRFAFPFHRPLERTMASRISLNLTYHQTLLYLSFPLYFHPLTARVLCLVCNIPFWPLSSVYWYNVGPAMIMTMTSATFVSDRQLQPSPSERTHTHKEAPSHLLSIHRRGLS